MFDKKQIMWMYALSSVHVGSGDDLSYIDLPIQREKHTRFPKIEASSLKGSFRHEIAGVSERDEEEKKMADRLLGTEKDGGNASAVSVSDARLLFFPVKSAKGIFAWVTCPMAIKRFLQDCETVGLLNGYSKDWLNPKFSMPVVPMDSNLRFNGENKEKIMLEEFLYNCSSESKNFSEFLKSLKFEELFKNEPLLTDYFASHTVLLPDDEFTYFVTQSTEVVTRIRVARDSQKRIDQALFTEEYLPPETILYSMLFFSGEKQAQNNTGNEKMTADKVKKEFEKLLGDNKILQVGGDMTLGKGLFRIRNWDGESRGGLV